MKQGNRQAIGKSGGHSLSLFKTVRCCAQRAKSSRANFWCDKTDFRFHDVAPLGAKINFEREKAFADD